MIMRNQCVALWIGSLLLASAVLLLTTTGCIQMAAVWANWTGGDVVEPEFKLTQGSLLVLVEDPRGVVTQPRALRKVHKTICEKFAEFKVNREVVPLETSERLQRTEKGYEKLSVRQIGEKLGAEQVLHISAMTFSLQTEPGAPLFKGEFVARVKLLSTEAISDNRLWPREPSGRRVAVSTHPTPTDGDKKDSDVADELATKLGESVAKMFYEHRELDD